MGYKVNDLFCGAGGMGLGFKQAGFEIVGAWDIDKYAIQSYRHNVNSHALQVDITQMIWRDLPKADIWLFGFPCQDLSVSGKQAGMQVVCQECQKIYDKIEYDKCPKCESKNYKAATRSGLFFEVMRLLEETEKYVPEQLPKVILAENVKGLKPYLPILQKEYEQHNYKMYYVLYNSKYWRVPQNRERYFVIGIHKSINKEFVFPEQREQYIPKLSIILENQVDEKYYLSDEKTKKIIEQAIKYLPEGAELQEIYTDKDGAAYCCSATYYKGTSPNDVGKCRRTHIIEKTTDGKVRIRRLTPREFARLQGFPEDYEIVVSDTQAYKQFGNAVTVTVAKAIAEQIKTYLDTYYKI
jgi:DNA (cytosine-5)-methyltransferase 1